MNGDCETLVQAAHGGVKPRPGEDAPDALRAKRGRYAPRAAERQQRSNTEGSYARFDDPEEAILHLIRATSPDVKWREGLVNILENTSQSEPCIRQILAYVHSCAFSGIKSLKEDERNVNISGPAPGALEIYDWTLIMDGLRFELTSPGAVRSPDFVDVTVGRSDQRALEGFCYLVQAFLNVSWTNLQCVSRLTPEWRKQLFETMNILRAGYGIERSRRQVLEDADATVPSLLVSLGFRRDVTTGNLLWETPLGAHEEFERLLCILHGLFRSSGKQETVV